MTKQTNTLVCIKITIVRVFCYSESNEIQPSKAQGGALQAEEMTKYLKGRNKCSMFRNREKANVVGE